MSTKMLWEILVPTDWEGSWSYFEKDDHHKAWDNYVHSITGGLTVLRPTKKGYWTSDDGKTYEEAMIPVRIFCTAANIKQIAEFTKTHYKQLSVMYYRLSDEVYFV